MIKSLYQFKYWYKKKLLLIVYPVGGRILEYEWVVVVDSPPVRE
jgi:hypothetical protein